MAKNQKCIKSVGILDGSKTTIYSVIYCNSDTICCAAIVWGSRGRRFNSCHSDQKKRMQAHPLFLVGIKKSCMRTLEPHSRQRRRNARKRAKLYNKDFRCKRSLLQSLSDCETSARGRRFAARYQAFARQTPNYIIMIFGCRQSRPTIVCDCPKHPACLNGIVQLLSLRPKNR